MFFFAWFRPSRAHAYFMGQSESNEWSVHIKIISQISPLKLSSDMTHMNSIHWIPATLCGNKGPFSPLLTLWATISTNRTWLMHKNRWKNEQMVEKCQFYPNILFRKLDLKLRFRIGPDSSQFSCIVPILRYMCNFFRSSLHTSRLIYFSFQSVQIMKRKWMLIRNIWSSFGVHTDSVWNFECNFDFNRHFSRNTRIHSDWLRCHSWLSQASNSIISITV